VWGNLHDYQVSIANSLVDFTFGTSYTLTAIQGNFVFLVGNDSAICTLKDATDALNKMGLIEKMKTRAGGADAWTDNSDSSLTTAYFRTDFIPQLEDEFLKTNIALRQN